MPILLQAMQKKENRPAAMHALGRLKDERAIEPLAAGLEDFFDQGPAKEALKAFGPGAEKAVAQRLNHKDQQVRTRACEVLQEIGTRASIPALEKAVASNDFFVSPKAKEAIQAIQARR